jgi:hypothetical protein
LRQAIGNKQDLTPLVPAGKGQEAAQPVQLQLAPFGHVHPVVGVAGDCAQRHEQHLLQRVGTALGSARVGQGRKLLHEGRTGELLCCLSHGKQPLLRRLPFSTAKAQFRGWCSCNRPATPATQSGGSSAKQHNSGGHSGSSQYTSWTRDVEIAKWHANKEGPGGTLLSAPLGAPGENDCWSWEFSDDAYGESEVLLKGIRSKLGVHTP